MKKKLIAITLLVMLASIFVLSACSTEEEAEDTSVTDSIIVATIDGEPITRTDYLEIWDYYRDYYSITDDILTDESYAEDIQELKYSLLESLVNEEVIRLELEALGFYDLTEDQQASVDDNVDAYIEYMLSTYEDTILEELGDDYTEKEYVKAVNKYTELIWEDSGFDEQYLIDYYTYEIAMERAETELLDLTITEEYVEEIYNTYVEEDKEYYSENLEYYEYYVIQSGYVSYYVPEGLRYIRQVLVLFDDETLDAISTLREEGSDDEADALREESLEAIYDEAVEFYAMIKNGDLTFDEALESEYNDDTYYTYYPEGYELYEGAVGYVDEFTEAGMALENIGDVSELVGTDYGYHILEYAGDVESGPIAFEDVEEDLYDEASESIVDDAWLAIIEEWKADYEIVYYYENLYDDVEEDSDELTIITDDTETTEETADEETTAEETADEETSEDASEEDAEETADEETADDSSEEAVEETEDETADDSETTEDTETEEDSETEEDAEATDG